MTAYADERRRIVDHLQPARIVGFANRDETCTKLVRGFDFALSLLTRIDLRRRAAAATATTARQRRQGVDRRAGAAEMVD